MNPSCGTDLGANDHRTNTNPQWIKNEYVRYSGVLLFLILFTYTGYEFTLLMKVNKALVLFYEFFEIFNEMFKKSDLVAFLKCFCC